MRPETSHFGPNTDNMNKDSSTHYKSSSKVKDELKSKPSEK